MGDERIRHCAECNLNVYNLSAMTERQVQELIEQVAESGSARDFIAAQTGRCLHRIVHGAYGLYGKGIANSGSDYGHHDEHRQSGFGKNNSQKSPSQRAANRQAKAGIWIMVFDRQGALVPGAEVRPH